VPPSEAALISDRNFSCFFTDLKILCEASSECHYAVKQMLRMDFVKLRFALQRAEAFEKLKQAALDQTGGIGLFAPPPGAA
jgi:hypothetical protein